MQGFKSSAVRANTSSCADLSTSHRTEPFPPKPVRLVADIDAALEQDVFDLAQRKRIADLQHYRQANDLGRRVEPAEQVSHPLTLRTRRLRIKTVKFEH